MLLLPPSQSFSEMGLLAVSSALLYGSVSGVHLLTVCDCFYGYDQAQTGNENGCVNGGLFWICIFLVPKPLRMVEHTWWINEGSSF